MRPRRGFALLASVWLMVAIAAVALEVSLLTRVRRLTTANVLESERARAAAAAALEHARAQLSRALAEAGAPGSALAMDPWRVVMGQRDTVRLDGEAYVFDVRDDGATLDVNRAGEEELGRIFAACGADAAAAMRAAQRIADWRDADEQRRAQGAERAEYLAAGARVLPRDGPVQHVSELDGVLGLATGPWNCVRPLLSVGGPGLVNVNTAPGEVLRALPGISETSAEAVVASRRDGASVSNFAEFVARMPPALRDETIRASDRLMPWLAFDTFAVHVHAAGWVPGSPVRVMADALMVRGGGSVFVQWQEFR